MSARFELTTMHFVGICSTTLPLFYFFFHNFSSIFLISLRLRYHKVDGWQLFLDHSKGIYHHLQNVLKNMDVRPLSFSWKLDKLVSVSFVCFSFSGFIPKWLKALSLGLEGTKLDFPQLGFWLGKQWGSRKVN